MKKELPTIMRWQMVLDNYYISVTWNVEDMNHTETTDVHIIELTLDITKRWVMKNPKDHNASYILTMAKEAKNIKEFMDKFKWY